jgi:NADP-dependent 3-hydroxy acid dehydrogenase YdfG
MVETRHLDIADEDSVQHFHDNAVQMFHRIDFAANMAGVCHDLNRTSDTDVSGYEMSYQVNQRGVLYPLAHPTCE